MKRIVKYGVQLVKEDSKNYNIDNVITSSNKAKCIVHEIFDVDTWHNEKIGMLCLDTANKIVGMHIIFEGTVNESPVFVREVATRALLNNAVNVILFHNHPAGTMQASQADMIVTKRIKEGLKLLDINLLDHIILGNNKESISMQEKGLI